MRLPPFSSLRRPRFFASAVLVIAGLVPLVGCPGNDDSSGDGSRSNPVTHLDLADVVGGAEGLLRIHGSTGRGSHGVPVAGGLDVDGDGERDLAFAAMQSSPAGRFNAGEVYLVFGDGSITGTLDTAVSDARILHLLGSAAFENTGSEIWLDDVTGDGLGDLLVARQNYSPDALRTGAGAVSILVGSAALSTHAATHATVDLANPPEALTITTLIGGQAFGRFGIWVRTGDVTGDEIPDLLIGADQENSGGDAHSGAVYLVRGGAHLAAGGEIDLAQFGATPWAGHIVRITPPPGSVEFHFGATCQIADLDMNDRGEVLAAAALNRAGATLGAGAGLQNLAHGTGGAPHGAVYIAWDDNFTDDPWVPGYSFSMDNTPGSASTIRGGTRNVSFGEEILGGLDFDDDGFSDLFIGDIVGDATLDQSRPNSGSGHLFYHAASLRNTPAFDLDAPPPGLRMTTFMGPDQNDIASDTALQGDFDGDGFPDLAFSSPHGNPGGRTQAGIIHIAHGQSGSYPERVDLRSGQQPDPSKIRITEIYGAKVADVLGYSAAGADYDGDGLDDLIVNEMLGDGLAPNTLNVGNLIVISGALIRDGP